MLGGLYIVSWDLDWLYVLMYMQFVVIFEFDVEEGAFDPFAGEFVE